MTGGETILLVDDEPSLTETGEGLLSYMGYKVHTASSGEEALEIVKKEGRNINIVIMDLMMPGIGGLKSLESMLALFPGMKIIIASGLMDAAGSQDIMKSGAAAFIRKPYVIDELNAKIREVLDVAV
jgi:DNA-binding NtrC family response regulator